MIEKNWLDKILIPLIVTSIFSAGGGLIYWLNRPALSSTVLDQEDVGELNPPVQTPKVKTEINKSTRTVPEKKIPMQVVEVQKQDPQTKNIKQPVSHRFPRNLGKDQVYFRVTKEGYALTSGDMLMGKVTDEQKNLEHGIYDPPKTKLWPSPEIPFVISEEVGQPQPIYDAIAYFNNNTPVRFVEVQQGDQDGIIFMATDDHCASHLGRVGGFQPILVSSRCGKTEIMHELMHALGFVHEHSRQDRDRYVNVLWENISDEFVFQFNIMPDKLVHNYTGSVFEFDPESIMLYPENAFAKSPSLKTLQSKGNVAIQPSRGELSRRDKERVYYLYGQ